MIRAGNTFGCRGCGKNVPGEKILGQSGMFLGSKIWPSEHHDYHAFHHDFTIKKPRSTTLLFPKPPQKTPIIPRKPGRRHRPEKFALNRKKNVIKNVVDGVEER